MTPVIELDCACQIAIQKVGRKLKDFTTDDANSLKCDSSTSAMYPLHRLCVYDGSLSPVSQHSENLFRCESFECPAMFKVSVNCTPKTFVKSLMIRRKLFVKLRLLNTHHNNAIYYVHPCTRITITITNNLFRHMVQQNSFQLYIPE